MPAFFLRRHPCGGRIRKVSTYIPCHFALRIYNRRGKAHWSAFPPMNKAGYGNRHTEAHAPPYPRHISSGPGNGRQRHSTHRITDVRTGFHKFVQMQRKKESAAMHHNSCFFIGKSILFLYHPHTHHPAPSPCSLQKHSVAWHSEYTHHASQYR